MQAAYAAQKKSLDDLVSQLRTREGDYSQVFDSARQAASERPAKVLRLGVLRLSMERTS